MMNPSDEQLLHDFYGGKSAALTQPANRYDRILLRIAHHILIARESRMPLDVDEFLQAGLNNLWTSVQMTRVTRTGRWPHQQLSALSWLIALLCKEMDRSMGIRGPF